MPRTEAVPRTEATQATQATQAAQAPPDLYRLAFHGAPVPMAILDSAGRFFRVNDALCALVGRDSDDLLGRPHECIVHPDDRTAPAGEHRGEYRLRHREGRAIRVERTVRALHGADGGALGSVSVWEDVEERRRTHDRLARLALQDPLTGVANRTLLDERLDEALRARDRDGGVVAVLFCDIDAFKAVNDSYGHGFGDTLLEIVAARLSSAVRAGDTVARVGGDEFVVVSSLHDLADADALLVRIGESLGDAIRVPEGDGLPLSVSVGMALADAPGMCAADLLEHADRQMYAAKRRRVAHPSA